VVFVGFRIECVSRVQGEIGRIVQSIREIRSFHHLMAGKTNAVADTRLEIEGQHGSHQIGQARGEPAGCANRRLHAMRQDRREILANYLRTGGTILILRTIPTSKLAMIPFDS
jgi:hypothetical protein